MGIRVDVAAIYGEQNYFQAVLDAQMTMLAVMSGEHILRCNKALLEFFGFGSIEELVAIYPTLHPLVVGSGEYPGRDAFRAWLFSPCTSYKNKVVFRNHEGETHIFKAYRSRFLAPGGREETILSLTDITEIESYSRVLQKEIDAASRAIKKQQHLFMQSRAAALGEMFDNIAHQWRQPIGAINNAIINAEFAMELLPKIFDPYFTTKYKAQGTGIGLYMSRTIIEKHFHGELKAENGAEGALFTVALPRYRG